MSSQEKRRIAILVAGMHRSGTSAVTRLLSLVGCDLPANLMQSQGDNETGFWESRPIMELNDEILASAGSAWDDWRAFDAGWYVSPVADQYRERAQAVLRGEFGDSRLFVMKDPRICRLLKFWIEAITDFGAQPCVISPIRNPLDVAASLEARNGIHPSVGHLIWLRHVLDAEKESRNLRRTYLRYETLLAEVHTVMDMLGVALDVSWPRRIAVDAEMEIDDFILPALHHHRTDDAELLTNPRLSRWLVSSFEILDRWCRGETQEGDAAELGQIRSALSAATPAFSRILAASGHGIAERDEQIHGLNTTLAERDWWVEGLSRGVTERDGRIDRLNQSVSHQSEQLHGLNTALAERDEQLHGLNTALAERDEQLHGLNTALAERDEQLHGLNTALAERDEQLHGLNTALAERDEQLHGLNTALAERDEQLHSMRQEVSEQSQELTRLSSELKRVLREQDQLLASRSWRMTAPLRTTKTFLRSVARLPSVLFRYRTQELTLAPLHQIERQSDGWLSTGEDPQFSVIPERGYFPARWTLVSYDAHANNCMLQLRFYVDSGGGYSEDTAINLSYHADGHARELVRFPEHVSGLRLDPMSWSGNFAFSNLRIQEIGNIFLLAYLVRNYVSAKDGGMVSLAELAVRSTTALIRLGPAEWKGRLVDAYRRSLRTNEQMHDSPWFWSYRVTSEQLRNLERKEWPQQSPRFSVVMPIYNTPEIWLKQAIESVRCQIYRNWELICVDDGSSDPHVTSILEEFARRDPRIVHLSNTKNLGVSASTNVAIRRAAGDYISFMDHDDCLEPHALWRFADAIVSDGADFLYSDEVVTALEDTTHVLQILARPAFSYDYYVSHPYFVHMITVRRSLVEEIQGIDESLDISQDVDFNLRALERAGCVTHIPDILYRWREHPTSTGHIRAHRVMETTRGILHRHFARLGFQAEVEFGAHFNTFDVQFFPTTRERVAVVIPTKNHGDLLRSCIESIQATTENGSLDLVIIDHDSDEWETQTYLRELESSCRLITYKGEFNFSKMNNFAIEQIKGHHDYYLFMNNDIEALDSGWFEAMLDRAKRPDVGVVGATLLFPDRTVQHAGVIIGMYGCAEHAFKFADFYSNGERFEARGCSLVATRDYSATTAACMLIRAEVFHEVEGFDETLPIGFNDTDLCLRVAARGYKILNHANAVLVHHESATRGRPRGDPHPEDSKRFKQRYRDVLDGGDPYHSPLLSVEDPLCVLRTGAHCPSQVRPRTTFRFLPGSQENE